jgi:hypothetical protein
VRGIYRFSSTSWGAIAGDGFNSVTDGGVQAYGDAEAAAGLQGMVWVDAYDNSSCTQTMSDSEIASKVHANVTAGHPGLRYQVGDEPTTNGCNAAPTYVHITQVVHGADASAKTWVADDQFNDPSISHWPAGLPMKGSVDILAFDVYPCQAGPCQVNMIDLAIERIHSVGLLNWEFILQDFGPCQSWRAPTASEVILQFQHWQGAGAIGYWVYTFDTDPTPCPGNVTGDGTLKQINAMPLNSAPASKTTPSPVAAASPPAKSPSPTAPSSKASPRPGAATPSPAGSPNPTGTPTVAASSYQPSDPVRSSAWTPQILVGIGFLVVLAGVGLNYLRRRAKR